MSNDAEEQRQIDSEVQETLKIMGDFNDVEQVECKFFYDLDVYNREVIETSKELRGILKDLIKKCRDIVEDSKRRRRQRKGDYI